MGALPFYSILLLSIISIASCAPSRLQHRQNLPVFTKYTAIGDSYSAGPGAGDYDVSTGADATKCSRSTKGYPNQLQALMPNPETRQFSFLSCTGYTAKKVEDSQISNLDPESDLITLSVGGNDVSFADIVDACIFRFRGVFAENCQTVLTRAEGQIQNELPGKIQSAISRVHARVKDPNRSQLYITGYAKFFESETEQYNRASFAYFSQFLGNKMNSELRRELNRLVGLVNSKIEEEVNRWRDPAAGVNYWQNVHFVNYDSAFQGHRFCEEGIDEPQGSKPDRPNTWFFQLQKSILRELSPFLAVRDAADQPAPGSALPDSASPSTQWYNGITDAMLDDPTLQVNPDYMDIVGDGANNTLGLDAFAPIWIVRVMHPSADGHARIAQAVWEAIQANPQPPPTEQLPSPPPIAQPIVPIAQPLVEEPGFKIIGAPLCSVGADNGSPLAILKGQCVKIWDGYNPGGEDWSAQYQPNAPYNCNNNCFAYPKGFGGIQAFGDGTKGTNCGYFSDLECKNNIGETGNVVSRKRDGIKVLDEASGQKAFSMQCYFNC